MEEIKRALIGITDVIIKDKKNKLSVERDRLTAAATIHVRAYNSLNVSRYLRI
jgi:hypothetical protein